MLKYCLTHVFVTVSHQQRFNYFYTIVSKTCAIESNVKPLIFCSYAKHVHKQ